MAEDKKRDDYMIEMGERVDNRFEPPKPAYQPPSLPSASWVNHPMVPILSYCGSSIMMTVLNKYVLLGDFNLNFLLLVVQVRGSLRRPIIQRRSLLTWVSRVLFVLSQFGLARLWA
jgi:hypothetical protein